MQEAKKQICKPEIISETLDIAFSISYLCIILLYIIFIQLCIKLHFTTYRNGEATASPFFYSLNTAGSDSSQLYKRGLTLI